jgi:hypothetical protein
MDIIAPIIKGLDHSSESAQERPPMRPLAVSDYQSANSAYDPQAGRSEVSLNEQLEAAKQREEEPATVTTRPENRLI